MLRIFLVVFASLLIFSQADASMVIRGSGTDVTAPEVSSATINDTAVVINFTEAVSQGANYLDSFWNIDGTTMGADVGLTYASGDGTASWTMTAATGAVNGETVDLDFVPGATTDIVEDAAGNDLVAVTSAAVTNNTPGGAWETVVNYASVMTSEFTDFGDRSYRLVIPADTAANSGTKIRLTFAASTNQDATVDGASVGASTANDDFDAAPTRITFSSNNTVSVPKTTTVLSDEITFTFDKTVRHLINLSTLARNFKYNSANTGNYFISNSTDYSDTQTVTFTGGSSWVGVSKVEVYVP